MLTVTSVLSSNSVTLSSAVELQLFNGFNKSIKSILIVNYLRSLKRKEVSLCFYLLVEQKKQFKDVKFKAFFRFFDIIKKLFF